MCPSEQFDGVFFDLFTFSRKILLKNVKKLNVLECVADQIVG